jgi:hypothetical protein
MLKLTGNLRILFHTLVTWLALSVAIGRTGRTYKVERDDRSAKLSTRLQLLAEVEPATTKTNRPRRTSVLIANHFSC